MKKNPIQIRQLNVNYGKTPALCDVSLTIPAGKRVAVIGPNGAGKSTLLKASLGLIKPTSGSIHFFGESLKQTKTKIAYIPQKDMIDWDFPMTLLELVLMGCYGRLPLFRYPKKEDKEKAAQYIKDLGLEGLESRQISQLSGGQQQKAFMARALMQEADLYFLDEPFSEIDVNSFETIQSIIQSLKEKGKTIVVVHHDLQSVPNLFDWVVLLNMRLVAAGSVKEIFTEDMVKRTFGQDRDLFETAMRRSQERQKGYSS